MRIAWIVPGGVDPSGVERVIPALLWQIERLAARHDLHVFALRQHPRACDYRLLGATVHSLAPARAPSVWWAVERGLHAHGPFDLVHAFWAGRPGLLAGLGGRRRRTPVLVTLAGGELAACPDIDYGGQLRWTSRTVVAASLRLAQRLTVATSFIAAQLEAAGYGADLVPLGAPSDHFTPAPSPPARPWRLLQVGSLNRVKDQHTLLAALATIVRHEPEVKLDLVGEDTLGGEIQREARAMGLAPFVEFAGWQPSSALAEWYRRAHLLLVTSRHESGPLSALEAALCGTPTAGTRVGHVADWAPNLASAAPVGDADALARAVLDLLHDEERRRRMAAAARTFALAHDAEWTANRFDHLYHELVHDAGEAAPQPAGRA
jgi:glycosyltransferase involved in cell wall biosynthesis